MNTILVIEDDEMILELVSEILEEEGFHVVALPSGLHSIAIAEQIHPDIILCDIMMPEMDGYSVLSHIRQEPTLSNVPFVFLSARASSAEHEQGLLLGADAYLSKPFTRLELLGLIDSWLPNAAVQQSPIASDKIKLPRLC